MRIIAGEWRGLTLAAPTGQVARPTTDRVKESMFNLLGPHWEGDVAVDLFAGSGALGLEALSRGVPQAVLVDVHPASLRTIQANVQKCRAENRVTVLRQDWKAAWRTVESERRRVGWVFVDPPYGKHLWGDVLEVLAASSCQPVDGVVCEHPKGEALPERVGSLAVWKSKSYGDICITIYRLQADVGDGP